MLACPPAGKRGALSGDLEDAMISEKLEPAKLIRRYKRFLADVEFPAGQIATIHCPNPGSMIGGIAEPGTTVWLRPAKAGRKLSHTWVVSELPGAFVCVDTLMANRLLFAELNRGSFASILSYSNIGKEKTFGDSRFDFFLAQGTASGPDCYMEVKSTTLAVDQTAMFPDAVTTRGLRHLAGLIEAARQGFRSVQFFCLARADVTNFRPADHIDPDYGKGLREASKKNVELVAWTMKIDRNDDQFSFAAGSRVPVILS